MSEKEKKKPGMIRKTLSIALGYGAFKRAIATSRSLLWNDASRWGYESTRDSFNQIRAIGKGGPERRSESFDAAIERLSLSAEDLSIRHDDLMLQAKLFRVLGYCALVSTLAAGAMSDTFFWFLMLTLNGLCVSAMFFSICFARNFRAWQIEERALVSVKEFIGAGGIYRIFF